MRVFAHAPHFAKLLTGGTDVLLGDFFLRSRCPVRAETFLRSRLEYSVERVRALLGEGSLDLALRKMVDKDDLGFFSFFSVIPLAVSSI